MNRNEGRAIDMGHTVRASGRTGSRSESQLKLFYFNFMREWRLDHQLTAVPYQVAVWFCGAFGAIVSLYAGTFGSPTESGWVRVCEGV